MGTPQERAEIPDLLAWVAETWRGLGAVTDPAPVCDTLRRLYSEPHRVYHDLTHIRECMVEFDECRELAARESEVAAALLFHDAVYQVDAAENEAASARLAERVLEEARIPERVRERIRGMILDTRHDRTPESPDSRLVVDIDLAGLALPERDFLRNTDRLIEEFRRAGITDGGRRIAGFLGKLLGRDRIYETEHFRKQNEENARRNVRRALRRLEGGV